MTRYYAGIGSRETPRAVLMAMRYLASELCMKGWILRSGGARGADSAFEDAVPSNMRQIFLPWPGYENKDMSMDIEPHHVELAMRMAQENHPAWHKCSDGARNLHARNSLIIMGPEMDTPVDFIACWTVGGLGGGGTGQALRIAKERGIEVFDFGDCTSDGHIQDRSYTILDYARALSSADGPKLGLE